MACREYFPGQTLFSEKPQNVSKLELELFWEGWVPNWSCTRHQGRQCHRHEKWSALLQAALLQSDELYMLHKGSCQSESGREDRSWRSPVPTHTPCPPGAQNRQDVSPQRAYPCLQSHHVIHDLPTSSSHFLPKRLPAKNSPTGEAVRPIVTSVFG